ncbi:MAG: YCF48-related protein [Bacteroidota bacterium]
MRIPTLLLLSLLYTCGCAPLFAQAEIFHSFPVDFITKFQDVHVDASGLGLAVGTCGVIRQTMDDGQMWEHFASPTQNNIESVACPPSGCATAIIVSDDGLFRLSNGSWTDVTFPEWEFDGEFHWLSETTVVLDLRGDFIYRSTDAGLNWSVVELPENQTSNLFFVDATTGYSVIDQAIYKTTDGGATFSPVGYTHSTNVFDLTWLNEDIGWFFDQERLFYKTTDGGKNWTLLNAESQLTSVNWFVALSETHLVGAQVTTSRLESTDGGVTWTRGTFLQDGNRRVNEKYHRRGAEFFTVGDGSQLLYSAADFGNFTELDPFGRMARTTDLAFSSAGEGYILAGIDLRSTADGGLSWQERSLPAVGRDVETLKNGDVVVLAESRGVISSDNGATFTRWYPEDIVPQNENPIVFSRKPNGDIYLLGDDYSLLSTDEGANFTAINHGAGVRPVAAHFLSDAVGYYVGRNNEFLKTTDGGMSWTLREGPARNLVGVFFTSEEKGYISTASTLYATTDGGMSWGVARRGEGGYKFTIHPTDGSLLLSRYLSGNNGAIARSTDGGDTWTELNYNCYAYRTGAVTPDGKYFWTGGDGGFVVRHDLEALIMTSSNDNRGSVAPVSLRTYPNPTGGLVAVELPPVLAEAMLQVYDLNGRVIAQYPLAVGTERLDVDLGAEPRGVYLLRWTAGGRAGVARVVRE